MRYHPREHPREPQASDNDFTALFRRVPARANGGSARIVKVPPRGGTRILYAALLFALGCALGVGVEILAFRPLP